MGQGETAMGMVMMMAVATNAWCNIHGDIENEVNMAGAGSIACCAMPYYAPLPRAVCSRIPVLGERQCVYRWHCHCALPV